MSKSFTIKELPGNKKAPAGQARGAKESNDNIRQVDDDFNAACDRLEACFDKTNAWGKGLRRPLGRPEFFQVRDLVDDIMRGAGGAR